MRADEASNTHAKAPETVKVDSPHHGNEAPEIVKVDSPLLICEPLPPPSSPPSRTVRLTQLLLTAATTLRTLLLEVLGGAGAVWGCAEAFWPAR